MLALEEGQYSSPKITNHKHQRKDKEEEWDKTQLMKNTQYLYKIYIPLASGNADLIATTKQVEMILLMVTGPICCEPSR